MASEADRAVSGQQLESLSDEELRRELDQVSVFARIHPDQKIRIVEALQDDGET